MFIMNKLIIYTCCLTLIIIGIVIDSNPFDNKEALQTDITGLSKKAFLNGDFKKCAVILGFTEDGREKRRKLFHLKRIAFDSLQVSSNDRLYFEEPDLSYILQFYRNEIALDDIETLHMDEFIAFVNMADSFSGVKQQNYQPMIDVIQNSDIYPTYLSEFIHHAKYYGKYCLAFFILLIFNKRLIPRDVSKFIFLSVSLVYIIDRFISYRKQIESLELGPISHKIGVLNLYETINQQNWWFLVAFIAAVLLYHFSIKEKCKKSSHYYEFTFIYFFAALMILFFMIEQYFGNYFIYKFQTPGYGYKAAFATACSLAFFIALGIFLMDRFNSNNKTELNKLKERALQSEAELTALQSSVNPHFLYNSLNSITALVDSNPEKTKAMSIALSNFYKYTTNRKEKSIASIAEEIDMIENYLTIEKIRFGDRLQYKIDVAENTRHYSIPYFILQPIIENAIKYGYNATEDIIDVHIKININHDQLEIKVYDSGKDFDELMDQGYGLRNITKKLKLLYSNEHVIEFVNDPKHVYISIKINTNV